MEGWAGTVAKLLELGADTALTDHVRACPCVKNWERTSYVALFCAMCMYVCEDMHVLVQGRRQQRGDRQGGSRLQWRRYANVADRNLDCS